LWSVLLLTETEDFQFSIEPDGRSGAGGDRTGHAHSGRMSLEMGFSVAGEHVGTLVRAFSELLKLDEF
jgi:hypothetical protein